MLWNISDVLMGVMAIINIPVILILSNTAMKALKDYERQLSVFIDTLLLCTATAMMCMSSGVAPSEALQGAPWVQAALQESLGTFGPVFITVSMVLFAFTTLLGNCFYCDNLLTFCLIRQ